MIDLNALKQFLFEGDYFGLIQAIYTNAFGSADIFYTVLSLIIVAPLYIRTKSLVFCAIAWILLGSFYIVAFPLVSGVAVLLVAMGLASLLFKIFMRARG